MLLEFFHTISDYSYILDIFSLAVSLLTLITMLRFRHRLEIELDRRELLNTRRKLQKELDGFSGSLLDGIYTVEFLQKIDLLLNDLLLSYKCFSWKLRITIRWTIFLLNSFYINDALSSSSRYRHKLCKKLQKISVLLRKED